MTSPAADVRSVMPLLEPLQRALESGDAPALDADDRRKVAGQTALGALQAIDLFQTVVLEVLEEEEPLAFAERATMLGAFHVFRAAVVEEAQAREHQLANAVLRSEERYLAAVRTAGFAIWDWDLSERPVQWSTSAEALLAQTLDALSNVDAWLEHVHPVDRERVGDGLRRAVEEGRPSWSDTFQFLRKDATYAAVIGRCWILHDQNGGAVRVVGGLTDVTEQRVLERRLAEQVHLTRTVADNAASCLFLVDGRGCATYLNPAAVAVTGYRLEDVRDRPLHDVLHPELPAGDCAVHRPGASLRDYECSFTRKDGTSFPASCSVTAIRVGEPGSSVLELRDITELKRSQLKLREAVQARDEFLSIAAHELRTPLTALQIQIQGMTRGPLLEGTDGRVRARLQSAERSTARIIQLVSELLDVSRLKAGRLELVLEELDFCEVVRDVAGRLQLDFKKAGSELTVLVPERLPGLCDRSRFDQVFTNLLSNALKYGEGKPVEVRLDVDGDHVHLQVVDHGIGIAPAEHARIFERFERAVSERHFGGFGLGLWIVRRVVDAMGGTIRVESQVGQGATFALRVPCRMANPEMRETAS